MKKNNKGFTLMEMLIVVAIIAILIAIAIPTFTNALNKAKEASDAANARSMFAQLQIAYMLDETPTVSATSITKESTIKVTSEDGKTVTSYKFSTVATAGTIKVGEEGGAAPEVSVTTNGTTYAFPASSATSGSSGS